METNPTQVMPVETQAIEAQPGPSAIARLGQAARGTYETFRRKADQYKALGQTVLALSGGLAGAEMVNMTADAAPAGAAGNVPGVTSAPDPSAGLLKQECVQAGLVMPEIAQAYMIDPGARPFQKDPSVPGPIQMVKLGAMYQAEPSECVDDYTFVRKAYVKMKNDKTWVRLTTPWAWVDKSGTKTYDRGTGYPNGHEGDWYYWKPGKPVKAVFENLVESTATHRVLGSKTKMVNLQIGHKTTK